MTLRKLLGDCSVSVYCCGTALECAVPHTGGEKEKGKLSVPPSVKEGVASGQVSGQLVNETHFLVFADTGASAAEQVCYMWITFCALLLLAFH